MNRVAKTLAFIPKPFNVMVRQCQWCKGVLGFKKNGTGISSGMCDACYDKHG